MNPTCPAAFAQTDGGNTAQDRTACVCGTALVKRRRESELLDRGIGALDNFRADILCAGLVVNVVLDSGCNGVFPPTPRLFLARLFNGFLARVL